MAFVAISITDYTKIHLRTNPNDKEQEVASSLRIALNDFKRGVKCKCGNDIWVIGSAFAGNSCYTCITGEQLPSNDYEIDEAINKPDLTSSTEPTMKYYEDDGTEFNPDLFPKPSLCLTCRNNDDPNEELLCNLTRMDQRDEDEFKCFAYKKM